MSRKIFTLIIVIFISLLSQSAIAGLCKLESAKAVVNINETISLRPARNGAPGTILFKKSYPVSSIKYSCNSSTLVDWHTVYSRSYASQSNNTFETEIPGIGVRITWPNASYIPGNSGTPASCSQSCTISSSMVQIEFVQLGVIAGADQQTIPQGEIAKAYIEPIADASEKIDIMRVSFNSAIDVKINSCSIQASQTSIDLGEYPLARFQTAGTQGDKKDFYLSIICPDADSTITLKFNSLLNPRFGADLGEIGVDSGNGSAENFSIRLFEKSQFNSPLDFKKDYSVSAKRGVETKKPLQAQIYIPNSVERKNLKAGRVSGAVQFTMIIN